MIEQIRTAITRGKSGIIFRDSSTMESLMDLVERHTVSLAAQTLAEAFEAVIAEHEARLAELEREAEQARQELTQAQAVFETSSWGRGYQDVKYDNARSAAQGINVNIVSLQREIERLMQAALNLRDIRPATVEDYENILKNARIS